MNVMAEINEKMSLLDDDKKRLILEIINNFLPDDSWADEVYEDDLHYIELARKEYANGETVSIDDI